MEKAEQIRQRISEMGGKVGPAATMIATVDSVDEENQMCVLNDDDLLIYEVRLRTVITGNESITIIPKVGTYVLAIRLENDEQWMILAADEIDKYSITVGAMQFEMDGEKFLLKNGADDLKKLMDDLFDAILAMSFTTNTGVTIKLVNAIQFQNLKTRVDALLKSV